MPGYYTAIFKPDRDKQHGAALLIMLVMLVLGVTVLLVNSLSASRVKTARQETTAAALAQAKDALIGFAVTYADTHTTTPQVDGYLPCPDSDASNGEGSSKLTCGSKDVSVIGRLPWRTLDLSALRDGDGECLWYVVSGTYKDNPKTDMMNWDTDGQLQVYASDGTLLASQVVAVIFAPGAAPLSGQNQNRSPDGTAPICGGNYTAANYLDNETVPVPGITVHGINNADVAIGKFIQPHDHRDANGNILLTMNDQMVFITRDDIWNAVLKRTDFQSTDPAINPLRMLTKQVAKCISGYGHYNSGWPTGSSWNAASYTSSKALPWPAPLVLSDYSDNAQYADSSSALYAGRVPYSVSTSKSLSNNLLGSNLMTSTGSCKDIGSSGAHAEPWTSNALDPWWNNWKDHLFYALSKDYRPRVSNMQDCLGYPCLQINSSSQYAAVILLAGPRLSALNQTRTDKSVVTNYLESANGTNFAGANGSENYISAASTITFNDTMCYINQSLGVTCP